MVGVSLPPNRLGDSKDQMEQGSDYASRTNQSGGQGPPDTKEVADVSELYDKTQRKHPQKPSNCNSIRL